MRIASAVMVVWLVGGVAPVAAPSDLSNQRAACELRYVDRAKTLAPRCLACHDGSAGRAVPDGHGSHPVGAGYGSALVERGGLRPMGELERRNLVLAFGRVTCTSCHDGRSQLRARLASADLCAGCHDK